MADNSYGVYVSIRTPSGLLWSSNRETWVEVQGDMVDAFGEEYVEGFIRQVLGEPEVQSNLASVTQMPAAAVAEAFDATPVEEPAGTEGAPQFEKCDVCGGIKDKWTPPGVSKKTGKPYPGFFGCSNFQNHRR